MSKIYAPEDSINPGAIADSKDILPGLLNVKNMFESIKHIQENGAEVWYGREVMHVLGYNKWQDFKNTVDRAKNMLFKSGKSPVDWNFCVITRTRNDAMPTGGTRETKYEDIKLSRYACYLVGANGNTPECAMAQAYFLTLAREMEEMVDNPYYTSPVLQERYDQVRQLNAREEACKADKYLTGTMIQHSVSQAGCARVKSKGDEVFFGGNNTQAMKDKLGLSKNQSLAEGLDPDVSQGRTFMNNLTSSKINTSNLQGEAAITDAHVQNASDVRDLMIRNGMIPEYVPPAPETAKKTSNFIKKEEDTLATQGTLVRTFRFLSPEEVKEYMKNHPELANLS